MQKGQRNKYLLKNTIIFSIGNFGTKFISFFLVPLYTNILSTSEYGTVDLIYTIGIVLIPFLTLNIAEAILRFPLDEGAEKEKIMSIGLVFFLISVVASFFVFPIVSRIEKVSDYTIYIFLYVVTMSASQIFLGYVKGRELLFRYSLGNIIQTLGIAVFNILFLVVLGKGIEGYLTAYIMANIVTAIYAFFAANIIQVIRNFQIDIVLAKKMIVYSVVLIPNSFMWWIMNSADRIMVTAMAGVAVNGIYAVAYKIPTLLSTFATIFNQAWSYSAIRESDSKDVEEYSNAIYDRLVSVVLVVAIGLLMVVKPIMKFYVGTEYYSAWNYVPYLMVGFVFMTLGSFVATSYTVHKDSVGFLLSGMMGAIANIVLNFIMIPFWDASGAALATCVSYIIVFIYRVYNTKKYLEINIFVKRHICGFALLIVTALTLYIDNFWGQVLLVLEFIISLVLFRDFIKAIWNMISMRGEKNE